MPDAPVKYTGLRRLLSPGGELYIPLHKALRSYLTMDQFLALELPTDMSPDESWDLTMLVCRAVGVDVPIPDLMGRDYWYTRNDELVDLASELKFGCRSGSPLHQELAKALHRRIIVRSKIDETIAAAQLDGLDIAREEAVSLLHLERSPRNATEQLVLNTLSAMDRLGELVRRPFSYDLLTHLESLLTQDLDVTELKFTTPRMGLLPYDYSAREQSDHAMDQLAGICAYANHEKGDPHDFPVLRALLLQDLFRFYRPMGILSTQIGRLAFRLYCLKVDLPVLSVLPLSRIKLDWEDGKVPAEVRWNRDEYFPIRANADTDLTPYMTLSVQFATAGMLKLESGLRRIEQRDAALRDLLQSDPEINHRQRTILGRALRNPEAEFRIAYHKTTHNIVYATARADLLQLVDKGYLQVHKPNRAMIFTAVPDLKSKLEHDHPRQ